MLNTADDASVSARQFDAEIERAASGAERQDIEGIRTHIHLTFTLWSVHAYHRVLSVGPEHRSTTFPSGEYSLTYPCLRFLAISA